MIMPQAFFYVPYRTKLAPPDKVLISSYNVPVEKEGLTEEIKMFMKKKSARAHYVP
ncbi:MAG: hypothetical protein UZ05_CHB002000621 [Chlorobi bacterium OLB5]|nr:MAG: hypothetical protein UZ05_CHB002000621 [Chlorobi bacterium OLB5]